jgi:GTP-binding protein
LQNLGKQGEIKDILLEMKCLADVGLVGLPNVGKSSILASVSRSLPKIANYPFTTLNPLVGKIRFIDDFEFTMADLPGIIEDAHKNKGLGLDFLRHIERTKVFLYVLDVAGEENEDLKKNLDILINEIKCYKKEFLDRPSIVAVNKCDLETNAEERFSKLQKECKFPCFLIFEGI